MNVRTRTLIHIQRYNPSTGAYAGIVTVPANIPITESCRRRFKLMEEDCVVLDFVLSTPVHFALGDIYRDEIFGTFYVTREQMPEYDTATGGYRYQLQLDREYMGWRNYKYMLTVLQGTTRIRKETTWWLTGKLAAHVEELMNNLAALGYSGYTYSVENSCSHAAEVRSQQYDGTDIITALNNLAEEYECEWWVDDEKVLHLGKCSSGTVMDFELGDNVESMTIQDNRNTYANKVYVFGSTNNIPTTYRKELTLTLTGQDSNGVWLADHAITPGMFPEERTHTLGFGALSSFTTPPVAPAGGEPERVTTWRWNTADTGETITNQASTLFNVSVPAWKLGAIRCSFYGAYTGDITLSVRIDAKRSGLGAVTKLYQETRTVLSVSDETSVEIPAQLYAGYGGSATLAANTYSVQASVSVTLNATSSGSLLLCSMPSITLDSVELQADATNTASALVPVLKINGSSASNLCVRFNPRGTTQYDYQGQKNAAYSGLAFYTASGASASPAVAAGTRLVLDDGDSTLVPTAYYATAYDDPAALARIGELRLRLPLASAPNGYLAASGLVERPGFVAEGVAVFDSIYPDGKLLVESVSAEQKTDYTRYEGETVTSDWQWEEYTLGVKLRSGAAFPFDAKYMLPNATLQVRFLTPEDIGASAASYAGKCQLAGMTFEARYNRGAGTYTLVRNDDYGALLPNNVLRPQEGDPCVLIGWNVKAMASLGLVADAEARLLAKGQEYMAALEEAQFCFECHMFGDFMSSLSDKLQYIADGDEVAMKTNKLLYVAAGGLAYAIPVEGFGVRIKHGALSTPKESRVIGYELNLAEPYSSPVYTVGETAAYSRLAKIEREITNK